MKGFDLFALGIGLVFGYVAKSVMDDDCSCHNTQTTFSPSTMGDIYGSGPGDSKCRGPVRGWLFCNEGEMLSCEGTGRIVYDPINDEYNAVCAACSPIGTCSGEGSYYLTLAHPIV